MFMRQQNLLHIFRHMSLVSLVIRMTIRPLIHTRTADIATVILAVVAIAVAIAATILEAATVATILEAAVHMTLGAVVAVMAVVVAETKATTIQRLSDCYDLFMAITFFIRSSSRFVQPARNTC